MISGNEIQNQVCVGEFISIYPFNENQINPNSYDLRLGSKLIFPKYQTINTKKVEDIEYEEIIMTEKGYTIYPGRVYLGSTIEYTKTKGYVPVINGKSSLARLGLGVHVTAGLGDNGFYGNWTLELSSALPTKIYPGMRICQIYYHPIVNNYTPKMHGRMLYAGNYGGSTGPIKSKYYCDADAFNEFNTV